MATLAEIDAELARRGTQPQQPSIVDIDAELAKRGVQPTQAQEEGFPGAGIIEPAAAIASGVVATPIAGIAGLAASPFVGPEKTEEVIKSVQEALTFIPRTPEGLAKIQQIGELLAPVGEAVEAVETATGEAAFEAAGGEQAPTREAAAIAGAAGEVLPTVALEATGLGVIRRIAKGAEKAEEAAQAARQARTATEAADISRAKEALEIRAETTAAIEATKPKITEGVSAEFTIKGKDAPEVQNYETVLDNLKKKKTQKAALDAMPDKDILDAANDLGVDLNPDHYSSNRVFQEVTQSLKSRPGSKLGAQEDAAIKKLGERADELIVSIGGEIDKSLLDAKIRNDITSNITDLEKQADKAYDAVNAAIPASVKVTPVASKQYITSVLDDLDGDKAQLSTAEKKLLSIIDKNPTYTALDRIRKDVGNGFRKGTGPFKDDNTGTLKQVYRVLSEDQQGVSDIFGVGADYAAARRLVTSRKQIEDEAIKLFGREMQSSLVPKITSAATALTKGDISKFNSLMNSMPEARRTETAATMLNNIFTQGARTGQPLGQGFVKAFEGLNRNQGAKNVLFNQLPGDARKRFDKIGRVATGIFRSKALENTSKTARDLISAMDDGGMFTKVYDVGRKAVVAEGVSTAVGLPGAGTASVIGATLAKGRTPASQAADAFITSKKFKDAIEESARTGDPKRADDILRNSKEFNRWKRLLSKEEAAQLTTVGFIPWITGQREEQP